ncbi:MAG: hypothetical protein D8M59_02350 [Planctomycetes bacterium]|nr:hypothetical protein [Planctomycetota bacterium]NOG54440.1 hypothetical protein [Planctomycetota bacterium]
MSLQSRITRLERSVGLDLDHCDTCGYPGRAVRVVMTPNDSELPACPDCGRPIDPDGRPVHDCCKRIIIPE